MSLHDSKQSGRKGCHFVYTWRGTPHDVGFLHGRTLRKEILREAQPSLDCAVKKLNLRPEKILQRVVSEWEPVFLRMVPRAVEEIHGIGEGSGLGYPFAFFAAIRDGLNFPPLRERACTSLVCGKGATHDGKILIAQTKDTSAPLDRYRIMRIAYDSGLKLLLLNYPGWIANICLTSNGLSFTSNSLYGKNPRGKTTPYSLLKRIIMEATSVREVLRKIRGIAFQNLAMLIADATGHAVCLESINGRLDIRNVSGKAFGHANSILCERFNVWASSKCESASSCLRQKVVQQRLDAEYGSITALHIKRIMRDHENFPFSICRHPSRKDPPVTTAAFVADLTEQSMHIAIGNPCVAGFRKYRLLSQPATRSSNGSKKRVRAS